MTSIKRKRVNRQPSIPGDILKEIFLMPNGISQAAFAQQLSDLTQGKVKVTTMKTKLSELIKGKRSISAEFAILISQLLGTNPKMWLNLQASLDLWHAQKKLAVNLSLGLDFDKC